MIFVLSVMCVVGGVPLWVECVFVSVIHPVAILSAVYCVICSLLIFVSDASGDHIVETYEYGYCYGFGCCADRFLLFLPCCRCECFEYLYCLAYVCCCDFYVYLGSRVSPSIFGLMFMGSVMLFVHVCISCRYDLMFAFAMFMSLCVDVMVMSPA